MIQALEHAIDHHPRTVARAKPLAEGSSTARALGTRYPIVQGPMTRVSDTVPFALAVADAGGLPFLALALMKGDEVAALLKRAGGELGSRPWGVGVLGFVPPELRREQIAAIRDARPPFAIIAGGRPDQRASLNIMAYLRIFTFLLPDYCAAS